MQTQDNRDMLSKRKLKNSAKNLFATLQFEIYPLENKFEVHE